jgi:hypothetical protein
MEGGRRRWEFGTNVLWVLFFEQVNQHFMYEATDDIDGVVGSFTENEEIRHEAVPSPVALSRA